MANVRVRVRSVYKISTINPKTDPQNRPPLEGKQSTVVTNFATRVMDEDEFSFWMAMFRVILETESPFD